MGGYLLRRLLAAIPSLLLVSLAVSALVRLVPGDVVMARLAEGGYVTPEVLAKMRESLGIDRPFLVQYLDWGSHLLRGDFGKSLWTAEPVLPRILTSVGVSAQIAIMAILLSVVIAIPLGVLSASHRESPIDYGARLFAITGLSLPDFWIATMLILVLTLWVGWLPEFRFVAIWRDPSTNLQTTIFPAAIVGYRFSAITARMMRSTMLEVLREDYIRTARAKGLRDRAVLYRHALRNAIIPVLTVIGGQIGVLLGGLVVIETVFSLPGMGRLIFDSVTRRDYPLLQGVVMLIAAFYIVVNLLIDVAYAAIDPRIRYH
ncbi:MAG: ABC transporter permease [Dehalococcoidia bacterium]